MTNNNPESHTAAPADFLEARGMNTRDLLDLLAPDTNHLAELKPAEVDEFMGSLALTDHAPQWQAMLDTRPE